MLLPKIRVSQVEGYFTYRQACDKQGTGDAKSLQKGTALMEAGRIDACSIHRNTEGIFFTGIVKAAMKKKVSYNYRVKLDIQGEPENSHCECPSGKGPHGTCKHIAAVMLMLQKFVSSGEVLVQKSCTETLQTFHKPKRFHDGSPVKAEDLGGAGKKAKLEDPRHEEDKNNPSYQAHVYNTVVNYVASSNKDLVIRYLYPKADLQQAALDHDYCSLPFLEHWVDSANKVTQREAIDIEQKTRHQSKCRRWLEEREYRVTASKFGDVCLATSQRNMEKLCKSILFSKNLCTASVIHGRQYESVAIEHFEKQSGKKVKPCGLFVSPAFPYLAATPDGVINGEEIIEVKCPYKGRNEPIAPGKLFPYLVETLDGLRLKETSKYYHQVQGQLFLTQRKVCHFIVYTFKELLFIPVSINNEFCQLQLIPKLELFYTKHYRKYVAASM